MTMKPKSEVLTPASNGIPVSVTLDRAYSFAGIHCRPHAMIFSRKAPDGSIEFQSLSFAEGLAQPVTMLDANPESRTETLETILWHKIAREIPGASGSQLFFETLGREFRERFGMDSPLSMRELALVSNESAHLPEKSHD